MTQPKPDSVSVWPLILATVLIVLATVCAALAAILLRSWPGLAIAVLGGCAILHPVWCNLVDRLVGNMESRS